MRRRRVLVGLASVAGALLVTAAVVMWGMLLVRWIHFGNGFDHGTFPALRKWTPLQLFASLCVTVGVIPVLAAFWARRLYRKKKRSGTRRMDQ